ncbi:MAG TPA: ribulose-phosphate 3-epimerase [Thermoanaerobaculia bacterium]|nr:ribulose-phosphate 3-epimerase [Thermoanaerobaculia bacterium]
MSAVRIAPSILAADFARLSDALAAAREGGADLVHVDVMDGRFVPTLTFGWTMVEALRKATDLPLDIHLMIDRPEETLDRYLCGVQLVSVHVESTAHLHRCLERIRSGGASAGAAINPATPARALEAVTGDVDHVLVMSVNPGWGGQKFIGSTYDKIRGMKPMLSGREIPIEIDGGVTLENAAACRAAGADILVAGTSVYGQPDPPAAIRAIRRAAAAAEVAK